MVQHEEEIDRIFISKGTIIGFITFIITLLIYTIFEIADIKLFSTRITIAIMGIAIIIMILGFIIDQLNYRGFRFWAFGAFISFFGVFIFFSPIMLYGLSIDDPILWLIMVVIGFFLIVFGYTVDAYELNNKLAKILINLWDAVITYQWKKIPGRIVSLFLVVLSGIFSYLALGIRQLKSLTTNFVKRSLNFTKVSILRAFGLLLELPELVFKTLKSIYNMSFFLLVPSIAIVFLNYFQTSESLASFSALAIMLLILFLISITYSNEDRLRNFSNSVINTSWKAVQTVSIGIQSLQSRIGRYKCQNCQQSIELGQSTCENCKLEVNTCAICKLPIKTEQPISTCSNCHYKSHSQHWDQWIRMGKKCPICNS